jgi:hypothetical protein
MGLEVEKADTLSNKSEGVVKSSSCNSEEIDEVKSISNKS